MAHITREEGHKKPRLPSRLLGMPATEAFELLLFIVFLAAALGAIFREKFLFVVLGLLVIMMLIEGHKRSREGMQVEKKIDRALGITEKEIFERMKKDKL